MQYRGFIFGLIILLSSNFYGLAAQQATFHSYKIQEVASGLHFPWSLAFLPDGSLLVTERTGKLTRVSNGEVSAPITGLPTDIYVKGQGGLLEVVLHPNFASNQWVYISYAMGNDDKNALQVMRAKLIGNELVEQQVVFTVTPFKSTPVHFAGRMAFLPDNTLLITSGDGFDYREDAQRLNSLLGKIIRINDDGSVPTNNPFVTENPDSPSNYVFSYGHRNHQSLLFDSKRNVIFSNEHGPDGGDELNIIQAGVNYGWPVITQGLDYIGSRISPFTEYPNMQQPRLDWTPSIAPSGMAVHQGNLFSELNGDLLVSVLKFKEVRWLHMDGLNVVGQTSLFKELEQRIRDVRVHPDGSIYILTDSDQGKILRIIPSEN
ncbi:PQQ-dependent sugar dehydrogenase [Paraglaciecola sp. MB-3u-78]|uniref:PQQ-dependent sugar dehydrogenase n=1 Tax=Paraglaciecola sp. MB-3u-78 TaxID=2058332 RepID=UPI000C3229F6|nr:PQQ-dependent sugar dehydrogenase [Paraglaciecola sp. MB-3u-78]PKG96089.1 glucose dehydrogenase [Paraglaciecola sp. MB-3u-78]